MKHAAVTAAPTSHALKQQQHHRHHADRKRKLYTTQQEPFPQHQF